MPCIIKMLIKEPNSFHVYYISPVSASRKFATEILDSDQYHRDAFSQVVAYHLSKLVQLFFHFPVNTVYFSSESIVVSLRIRLHPI
jgi:hypothetical protein